MKIKPDPKSSDYLMVYNEGDIDVNYLLGWKPYKNSLWMKVEDNLVNRIVLGLPILSAAQTQEIKFSPIEQLKDYQNIDVKKLCERTNSLNANPMGLGKTLETIMVLKQRGHSQDVLILCPKSVVYQWRDELIRWWPEVEERISVLPTRVERGKIVIMNYERIVSDKMLVQLKCWRWNAVVCDEAHRIKNRASKRTQAVNSIPCSHRFALTGTPILNKPNDLWSLLHWLDWRFAGKSYWKFTEYFCEIEENFFGRRPAGLSKDPAKASILNVLLEHVGVRNDLSVTSGKTQETVSIKMTSRQRKLYENTRNLILEELPKSLSIQNGAVHLLRLQQVTSNPEMFDEKAGNAKFDWIEELLQDNPEEKIVVYSRFAEAVLRLERRLGSEICKTYHGGMRPCDRAAAIESFRHDPKVRVIAGTIGALGTGVDGLQYASRVVVFLDRDWSPAMTDQAEDRVNRMGQERPVIVYYLDCIGTVDKYVGRVTLRKREDIERCLT